MAIVYTQNESFVYINQNRLFYSLFLNFYIKYTHSLTQDAVAKFYILASATDEF
jgi:hypothetical protein